MKTYYTDEKQAQVVLALLKEHGIRKVIASPGATNVTIVASMQSDPYFEMFSVVDERSASYMACGLAAESGEPVVLSCTGATASRNYLSGMTEAFYRKLPLLAITSTQIIAKIGHCVPQVIDRSSIQNDVAKFSVTLPVVKDDNDLWECEIKTNQAILELKRHGGGPVHINLPTTYSKNYGIKDLPRFRVVDRININDDFPKFPKGKVAVFAGAQSTMTEAQVETIDRFCASNNAVVFCDHTSGYKGKYRVLYSLAACQILSDITSVQPDLLIHIGEISGDYYSLGITGTQVWRVSEDGEIRDTFQKLRYIFEMNEQYFFKHYTDSDKNEKNSYLQLCKNHLNELSRKIPELPFSNIWLASKMAHLIPKDSTIHFAILNSLRAWNFFELPNSVLSMSNVGGFGIDGCVSSLIGASLSNKNKLFFGVFGDLSFFYDLNSIGNRYVGKNLRLLLVNNGKGTEFRNFNHLGAIFDDDTDKYIAAAGHFGNKSKKLVKHYAQDLGFEYFSASTKEEFNQVYKRFLTAKLTEKPILFEVFTNNKLESNALETIMHIQKNVKGRAKNIAKKVLGEKKSKIIKKVVLSAKRS